ncbi:MAG: glycosyltransferase family 4 protein [Acidobacteriota bacterium]|nr:glycosyltransferase family 4 protein [Acidobacteriota bacterium]
MKILAAVVIPPHLSVSGAVTAALALSEAIADTQQVDIALMAYDESTSSLGKARLLRRRARNPLRWTRGILPDRFRTLFWSSDIPRLVARGAYDLVHLHNPIPALELRRIARACKRAGVPYVISTHGFVEVAGGAGSYGLRGVRRVAWDWFVRRPFEEVVRNASRLLALSPEERPILHRLGVHDDDIRIVTNGVDAATYDAVPDADLAAFRDRFDLPKPSAMDPPVCAFLGNHTSNKGIDVLLDGFCRQDLPFLLVVGGMMKPHNVRYDDYASHRDPGCRQRIVFTDLLEDREARALMRLADLFVFPTRADTLPLVILEAMASETTVLATRVGGIPYQIDETCGRLIPPGDPDALGQAYRDLYERRSELSRLGRSARARVESRFSWPASATSAMAAYRELVSD